jgi:hypothetical protein
MADYPDKTTSDRYVRESTYRVEPAAESSGSMWFILGGIVVALAVLFAIFYNGDDAVVVPADNGAPVTIENNDITPAPAPDAMAPAPDASAPADTITPAPDATAPADTAPAPAETETAPTAPAAGN